MTPVPFLFREPRASVRAKPGPMRRTVSLLETRGYAGAVPGEYLAPGTHRYKPATAAGDDPASCCGTVRYCSGPARSHFPAQSARWTSLLQVLEGHSAAPSDSQRCEVKTPHQIRSPLNPPPNKQSTGVDASEGATLPWTFSTDTRRFPTVTGRSVVCPPLPCSLV